MNARWLLKFCAHNGEDRCKINEMSADYAGSYCPTNGCAERNPHRIFGIPNEMSNT